MLSKELIDYFEKLRSNRGISQLSFIEDIVSPTQYRRYLNAESNLPLRVIVAFSERLGLKYDYVLDHFDLAKNVERGIVTRLMNTVITYNFKEFDKLAADLDVDFFIQERNRLIFKYVLILKDLFQDKISKDFALKRLKDLVDYPNILEISVLSVSQFMILGEIVTLLPANEQKRPLERLKKILENPQNVISGNNERLVIMLLVRIIKTLGINDQFEEALFYCQKGLKICRATQIMYALDYLYYYAALCYDKLGDTLKRDDMIYATFLAANVEGDKHNAKKFIDLLESDFNILISDFMKSRL